MLDFWKPSCRPLASNLEQSSRNALRVEYKEVESHVRTPKGNKSNTINEPGIAALTTPDTALIHVHISNTIPPVRR